jgi:hypothetical protein
MSAAVTPPWRSAATAAGANSCHSMPMPVAVLLMTSPETAMFARRDLKRTSTRVTVAGGGGQSRNAPLALMSRTRAKAVQPAPSVIEAGVSSLKR